MCSQFWRQGAWQKSARGHVTLMLRYVPLHRMRKKALVGTVRQWWKLDCMNFRFAFVLRLACSQTVIPETDKRLVWFLTAGIPSSYRRFLCKHSDIFLLNPPILLDIMHRKDTVTGYDEYANSSWSTGLLDFHLWAFQVPLMPNKCCEWVTNMLLFFPLFSVLSVRGTFIRDCSSRCGTLTPQQGASWEYWWYFFHWNSYLKCLFSRSSHTGARHMCTGTKSPTRAVEYHFIIDAAAFFCVFVDVCVCMWVYVCVFVLLFPNLAEWMCYSRLASLPQT